MESNEKTTQVECRVSADEAIGRLLIAKTHSACFTAKYRFCKDPHLIRSFPPRELPGVGSIRRSAIAPPKRTSNCSHRRDNGVSHNGR